MATGNSNPKEIQKMPISEIEKWKKADLQQALIALLEEEKDHEAQNLQKATEITDMLKKIVDEVTAMREERKEIMDEMNALRKENEKMRAQLKQQGSILKHHQQFMERIDAKERGNNLIILGIQEGDDQSDETDLVKVHETVNMVSVDTEIRSTRHLGAKEANKNRPIMVVLNSMEERNKVVDLARNSSAEALKFATFA
jgi:regulator of replication initiation timing